MGPVSLYTHWGSLRFGLHGNADRDVFDVCVPGFLMLNRLRTSGLKAVCAEAKERTTKTATTSALLVLSSRRSGGSFLGFRAGSL